MFFIQIIKIPKQIKENKDSTLNKDIDETKTEEEEKKEKKESEGDGGKVRNKLGEISDINSIYSMITSISLYLQI